MEESLYDQLPEPVRTSLESFDETEDLYSECRRVEGELHALGYSVDWGLSGELYNVQKIGS